MLCQCTDQRSQNIVDLQNKLGKFTPLIMFFITSVWNRSSSIVGSGHSCTVLPVRCEKNTKYGHQTGYQPTQIKMQPKITGTRGDDV